MAKPQWFRIAREGGTVDGRTISGDALVEMSDKYDTSVYGARINKEHIRGFFFEEQFGAFGDVLELKTEKDDKGKTCLLGLLDPTDELVALNKKRQKVYTSIEMGKIEGEDGFYLTGLAVTDSPASTGTSMLNFSVGKNQSFNATVKDDKGNDQEVTFKATSSDWSDHFETDIDFGDKPDQGGETLYSRVKNLLSKKQSTDDSQYTDISEAVTAIADSQRTLLDNFSTIESSDSFATLNEKLNSLEEKHSALVSQLEKTPGGEYQRRPEHSGGDRPLTNC